MPVGETIQQFLGLDCHVSGEICDCTNAYWSSLHPTWHFVTELVNRTRGACPAGFFFLTDASGRCGAGFGQADMPTKLACPPGFYCAGGLEPPRSCASGDHCPGQTAAQNRRCEAGFFCPFPAAPMQRCMDGGMCEEGSVVPKPCPAGMQCRGGEAKLCPKAHYCPFACVEPVPCNALKSCPEGSSHEHAELLSGCFLISCVLALYLGARSYHRFAQSGLLVCTALAVVIGLMYLVDRIIAGFLSLTFVAIAANYILLSIGACPPIVARILMCATFLTGLGVLWMLNPAWSMLCAGLLLCFAVGWLMTRENFKQVAVGRVLLVLVFVGLIFAFAHVDASFLLSVLCVVGLWAAVLICTWLCEQRNQPGRASVPFRTRWGLADGLLGAPGEASLRLAFSPSGSTHGSLALPASGHVAASCSSTYEGFSASYNFGIRHAAEPPSSTSATPTTSEARPQASHTTSGVSFQLEAVGFRLLDGTPLLKGITLSISPGRRVAVMGPSGSGKTTLLAVLSGRASYGHVVGRLLVGGEAASDLRFLRHVTGYVPQDDILHGELTVEENIRFQAKLRLPASTTHEEIEEAVAQVEKDLDLSAIAASRIGTSERRGVSGGQRKRVSIAMELVAQPLLLFADEPTSGLDSTTAHEVVGCMNGAAKRLGTTVLSVIHQPRYETLLLFDDLVLLATGGSLVYAGPAKTAKDNFAEHLHVLFSENANPADVMLDAIRSPGALQELHLAALRESGLSSNQEAVRLRGSLRFGIHRDIPPFFRAVLILMDRAMLQTMRAHSVLIVNQVLCVTVMFLLCTVLKNESIENFMMQSCLATLFLMLLQGVAAQRIFGVDLLITLREARVGLSMIAYLVAKDLASLFEITLSAAVFASSYGVFSGVQQPVTKMFAGAWAFVYSVYGLSYIFSICLSPGAAQMSAVVAGFISFCVSGVYQPQLPVMAQYLGGRGWMVPALSPVRWFWGYLLTAEMRYLTPLARHYGAGPLTYRGYDLAHLEGCSLGGLDPAETGVVSLREAWTENRGWVCSGVDMLLLGIMFRFLAGLCLLLYMHAQTSRWAQFFGQSDAGLWKLLGKLFTLLVGSFLALFLFAEVWILGIQGIDFQQLLQSWGIWIPS